MKLNSLVTAFLSALCIGGCCCKCEPQPAKVVTSASPALTEVTAAKELESYLAKCAESIIVDGDVIRSIHIGDSEAAVKAGILRKNMDDDSFVIKKIGNDIIINGGGTRGVLYGTFDFIERILDVRFFTPACTYVPEKKIIKVDCVDKEFKFIFALRDIYIGKAYNPDGGYSSYCDLNGALHSPVFGRSRTYDSNPWQGYELHYSEVMALADGVSTTTRGSWAHYAAALVCSAICAVAVAFPYTLFELRYHWSVKNPEPTDFYLRMNEVGGGIAAVVLFIVYLIGVTKIV